MTPFIALHVYCMGLFLLISMNVCFTVCWAMLSHAILFVGLFRESMCVRSYAIP